MKRTRCTADESEIEALGQEGGVTRDGVAVYFHTDVTKASVLALLKCVREASACATQHTHPLHKPTVYLYIHSGGGDAYAGLSGMDHLLHNSVPITTVADGMVASAATFLLLAGSHRIAFRHSFLLIHQLSTGFEGKYAEMLDEVHNSHALMDTLRSIYRERTSLPPKRMERLLHKEVTMDAEHCLKDGFVHELA